MNVTSLERRLAKLEQVTQPYDDLDVLAILAANLTGAEENLLTEALELGTCHTWKELASIMGNEKWSNVVDVDARINRELQKLWEQYKVA